MHVQLSAALKCLDDSRRDFGTAIDAVAVPLRGQKPAPGRWSIDDVVEHVSKVERVFVTALIGKIDAARAAGLAPEVDQPAALPDQTRTTLIDRSNPRVAPEPVQPTGGVPATASLEAIDALHARLEQTLGSCDGLALSTITHDHRFFGTLNVYQWVELIAGHECRHTEQLREIAVQVSAA